MKTISNTQLNEKKQILFLNFNNSKRIQWSAYRRYSL